MRAGLVPNIIVSVVVESFCVLSLNIGDRVFFAEIHRDGFASQCVDDANATLDASDLPDDVS